MEQSITLLRPPMVVPKWAHVSSICPPLGLAYVAASLVKSGRKVRCVDALGEDPLRQTVLENENFLSFGLTTPEIVANVGKVEILGVSLMFSHDWPLAKEIIQAIHKENPNAKIICGGEHVSAAPEFCLQDCPEITYLVLGEGEETINDLLDALKENRPLDTVQGIAFRDGDQIKVTERRGRIKALESIEWPAWDLFPLENYLKNELGYGVNPGRSLPILASRGCPFQCTFCSNLQMWSTKWQARKVDDVINEMQFYIDKFGAQNFDFYDLTTIVRKDWIVEFCQKIIDRNWNITWQMPAGTRSEALDAEVLHLLRLSGEKNITYAPESGSVRTLKAIKKRISLSKMKESIRFALKEGMNVKLNMIMGFPNETYREIFDNFRFLAHVAWIGVHDVYVACFSPYPGSELFDELLKNGKIKKMDSNYFLMLTSYSDIRFSFSYTPHISDRMLTVCRLGGMMWFYALSYLFHPFRVFRLISNLIQGREESRLDMALLQLKSRIFAKKASA